ncbi:MAG: flagellar export protein FliJ [Eubacteriales bacterium]|nr:flagellar export protein FliJ [Eubacteriales bacterium]
MAKFIYRMQNILNIKERLETQAKTEFAQMTLALNKEEDIMRSLVSRMRAYEDEIRALSGKKINVNEMKRSNEAVRIIKEQIAGQAVRIKVAERNLNMARAKLGEAVQDRKIQEKLREKAFDDFKLQLNASEMKEVDEVVSFNYNNRGTGE